MADSAPRILDHNGRPIQRSALTKEIARPSLTGVRQVWWDSIASGLTPESLATVIMQVDQNDILDYLTLAEEMEERDLHYRSVLSTRKLAVSGLNPTIESYTDEDEDVELADACRDLVTDDAFPPLVKGLLDAIGKGFAVSEIMWDRGAQYWPTEYTWRDPRHFQFDHETGSEIRLRDEKDVANGLPLEPYKFVAYKPNIKMGIPIRGGLARLAVVAYMCKGYTIKDWMAFAEVFGMPLRLGKYGMEASSDQKAALLTAVSNIGTDAAAIIPESMVIEFISAEKTAGGEKLFIALADWLDKQVSKGVLGQTATVEGTVGKLGAEEAQEQVRDDIREDDAKQLAAVIQRDLIKPFVDLNFGPRERGQYPRFRLATEEKEDLESLSTALPPFIDRGLRVQASVIRDKFGLPEPEDESELLQPKGQASTPGVETDEPPEPVPPPGEPPPEPTAPGEPEPEPDDVELNRELQATARDLMAKVRKGESLTADQRGLVAMALAQSRGQAQAGVPEDEIDRVADEALGDWKKMMDPILQPILDHAKASGDYQEFLAGLEDVMAGVDSTEFATRLAVATFKVRGLGDGTDEV